MNYTPLVKLAIVALCVLSLFPRDLLAKVSISLSDESHQDVIQKSLDAIDKEQYRKAVELSRNLKDDLMVKYIHWNYLKHDGANASFKNYSRFIRHNSHFPSMNFLRIRAEQKIPSENLDKRYLKLWFREFPPITGFAKVEYVRAFGKKMNKKRKVGLIRSAWRKGDFDKKYRSGIYKQYKEYLRVKDLVDRVERLINEDKISQAKSELRLLPKGYRAMFTAVIALLQNKPKVTYLIKAVPKKLLQHPSLVYARIKWRDKRNLKSSVREALMNLSDDKLNADKWWIIRDKYIREAIFQGKFQDAYQLLKGANSQSPIYASEALWLKGWLNLEYLNRPIVAKKYFSEFLDLVNYPVSLARGHYWLARSWMKLDNLSKAKTHLKKATKYPMSFYGQISLQDLYKNSRIEIPKTNMGFFDLSGAGDAAELLKLAQELIYRGKEKQAYNLLHHFIDSHSSRNLKYAAGLYALKLRNPKYLVLIGKQLLRDNIIIREVAYPVIRTEKAAIPNFFVHAISRQESQFDHRAVSSGNAYGVMQILHSTAKQVARRNRIKYSRKKLFDPHYNIKIGSIYLKNLLNMSDGSYVRAIASYNAGPTRVRNWMKKIGNPDGTDHRIINWIERLPLGETRNYLHRVLENIQIYRILISRDNAVELSIKNDIRK